MATVANAFGIQKALEKLGVNEINKGTSTGSNWFSEGEMISSHSPVDGKLIGKVTTTSREDYEKVIKTAQTTYKEWRKVPAPQRGEIVRQIHRVGQGVLIGTFRHTNTLHSNS